MLARVDSGWQQEAVGWSNLYISICPHVGNGNYRRKDMRLNTSSPEMCIMPHYRDRTGDKKGSDGPNVVTRVYFLIVSSESSSETPDRLQQQSAPARQIA